MQAMTYKHPENRDKPYVDWRLPENRMKGFMLWLDWKLKYYDLDQLIVTNTYRDASGIQSPTGAPMNEEQKLWFSLLFGCTYQSSMAWTIYWHFPNFWDINLEELQKWNLENMWRQQYAKDTKYNKGRIVEQVKSMQELIGPYGSIKAWVDNQLTDDPHESFVNMYTEVSRLYKFGRMTSWLCNQALFETGGVPVRPATMLCTDQSCWSVRSGLCYLYGRDDIVESKTKVKLSKDDLQWIASKESELYAQAYDAISPSNKLFFSNYLLESQLCQYKKLMLGGEYAGGGSGDHYVRGCKLRNVWGKEVNYDALFETAVQYHHPLARNKPENKPLQDLCAKTGQMINLHTDNDSIPNMYLELGIDPEWLQNDEHNREIKRKIEEYANV
jgi:hypothetical protein